MKNALIICMLLLVGCATGGVPREIFSQRNLSSPVYSNPLATPIVRTGRVVRLVDSRMIQETIRESREGNSLSLREGRVACYIGGVLGFLWVIYKQSESDCEPGHICIE